MVSEGSFAEAHLTFSANYPRFAMGLLQEQQYDLQRRSGHYLQDEPSSLSE